MGYYENTQKLHSVWQLSRKNTQSEFSRQKTVIEFNNLIG